MKKLITLILVCTVIIVLVFVFTSTDAVISIAGIFTNETVADEGNYEDAWYFNKLNTNEQEVYRKFITAAREKNEKVVILTGEDITVDDIDKAFEAFLLDNPEIFYVDKKINISNLSLGVAKKISIELKYSATGEVLQKQNELIEQEISKILNQVITSDMTDFEKELAIHDYLVESISYYEYDNIDEIPHEKHTIYGALVEKEAVCDGISKVFQILMNRLGIESITVTGTAQSLPHAWNKVNIDNEWYNVDVTSDEFGKANHLNHVYFNVTDSRISITHEQDSSFLVPSCTETSNNYFYYYDFVIDRYDHLNTKLKYVIQNSDKSVLEFMIIDEAYSKQDIVNELYDLNYNNYKTNNITQIKYFYQEGIYLFKEGEV